MFKVAITDYGFPSVDQERAVLNAAGFAVHVAQARERAALLAEVADADALLVQYTQLDAAALSALPRCRVIVRYGIGVDNIDLAAAKARGIAVCNVPDYGIDEVADHAVSMAVALGRQLPQFDRRLREGVWKQKPDFPMPAFREMVFATAGFGRIARATLDRARGFKFKLAAYDPYIPAQAFADFNATQLGVDELFAQADVLSLHLPLTEDTRHFVNEARLRRMKPTVILVNTARGPLIDAAALAQALTKGIIGAAGLDVFDQEPLSPESPLLAAPNVLLSPHIAWYSERSGPTLQKKAAEEIVRGLRGEPLVNRVA